ncbi:MAG: Methionine aminopeptidase 1 [Deltaproteobacteria bacterium ADurb.Bin151]|jgi:methionyl aminopeptidase|nr:type I methionyl aminopeptidase [Smithella sp.]OQB56395.1 MAG: Methionine aminopeptidase 1 [Deltaproteobacteria bacterium ADurb.Bin151]HNZ09978.1 type I methionyl aminopeptidase [Smithellaceae bacterium]HOQ40979.1 type I methionyl aminopeptidase [Smithellaceae bacterium]HPL67200.1 type I methionyl aminopeptidase [Smithellaceae bacterium]
MVVLKHADEIEKARASNRIVAEVLSVLREKVKPGLTTMELDKIAESITEKRGAKPAFKGYRGYPFSLCTSVNEEVVHGMPSNRVLMEGDIIGLDFGVYYQGLYGDSAVTLPVGRVDDQATRLMQVTEQSLYMAINQACAGNRLGDISATVQETAESSGYSVVRDFVGHGIGKSLHEDPQIPNFGKKGRGIELKRGMILAIEPMINAGKYRVKILSDGWTVVTADGSLSAHFEHSVAITDNGPEILSKLN